MSDAPFEDFRQRSGLADAIREAPLLAALAWHRLQA